ncbi:MAG: hypothetical protein R3E53_08800 [Myxococcota bacterium]
MPFYGIFDFLDRAGDRGRAKMEPVLAERVFDAHRLRPRALGRGLSISQVTPRRRPSS